MTRNNFWEAQPLGALKVSTTSRVALILSHSPALSKLLVTFILIIYQVEIFTIVLKPTAHSIKTGSQAPSQIFINVYNTVYFEELDIITKSADNVLSLLGIIGIYLFLDISIFLCMTVFLHRGKQLKRTVENVCNALSCIHQLILFGPIHVYCCKVLYLSYNREDLIFSSENLILLVKILCLLIMVTNSIWCLIKILLFTINIKTKDPLSSKTNLITLLDFIFRVTLPLLEAFALPHGASIGSFLIANLVYSVLRDYFLFYTLPYYRVQTLKIATICHAVITSLAFAAIISRPISQSRAYPELEFLLPFWVGCIVVFRTLYTKYLNRLTQAILQHPATITNPYHLIHYLIIYKLYAKCSQPAVHSDMIEEKYFIYTSIVKQSAVAHLLPVGEDSKLDHRAQTLINGHFVKYSIDLLENAIKKNQKFSLLRMTLAHYYTKHERRYMLAYQILGHNLQHSFSQQNSSVLVKILIWNGITNQDSNQDEGIIQKYIHLQEIYKNLNNDIKEQLKKGVQFWKDFQKPDTEFYSLVNLAGQISKKSKDITKSVAYYQIFKEANFVEPLLVYTFYFFFVKNDILKAQKFFQEYNRLKLRKIQVDSILSKKSKMFPSDALFFTLSTSPKHFGTILDCSGQAMNKLGITKELFVKRHLSTIMPQSYAKWYDDYLKGIALNSNLEMLNKAMDIPIMMKDGHIMSHWMHITLNYSNEFGLCLSGLLRPIRDFQRTVLIMKNGHILNTTREFAKDMNIEPNKYWNNESIFDFCPSLEEIIFNYLSEGQRYSTTQNRFHHLSSVAFEKQEVIPVKEIQLQFFPSMNSKIRDYLLIDSERNNRTIVYTIKIYLHNNQGNTFFELKMEKVKDNKHQSTLLTKPSPTHTDTHRSLNIYTAKEILQKHSSQLDPMNAETMYPLQKREISLKALRNKKLRSEAIDSQIGTLLPSKRETNEMNKTNMNYMETISESVNNCVTHMNTPSERKEFLSSPKGDTDNEFDAISDEQRSNHDFSSVSFDNDIKKMDDTLAMDFMSISSANSSSLFSNVKRIDVYKVMRKAIDSRAYKWSSHAYNLCFIATFIVQMGFLIWLNIYTSSISHGVGALSQVIQSSYLRTYWLKIATMDMMSWISVKGGWFDYDWEQVREVFKNDLYKTSLHNQDLGIYLNAIDEEVQQQFYEKQVELYERDSFDNPQLVSIDDTFEATKKIINYGLISSDQLVPASGMNIINTATQFVAENGLNNFLIVAENLTSFVEDKLFRTLTNAKRTMLGALFGGVAVIILFIFVSLRFVNHINTDASRFMELLFSLPADEVAKTDSYLSTLTDLLEKETDDTEVFDTLNGINPILQRKVTFKDSKIGKTNKSKKIAHKASMKKFNSRNYFIFYGLFVCLGSLMAVMIIYHYLANDKIVVMERQHTGLNSALNFANTMAFLPVELQGLLLWNGTLTVENKPPLQFLEETIGKLSSVTNFTKSLEDSKGDISSVQQAILFNYSCDQAYTPYYSWPLEVLQVECESISDGLGYTGLINVLMKLEHELDQFIYDFENKPRELLDLQNLLGGLLIAGFCTDIGFVLLFNSFAYSLETFGNLVTELENRRVILAWIAVISSIALGVATWIFIIRRLVRKEFEKKRMLALVPNRLIFGSYLLTKYITTSLK